MKDLLAVSGNTTWVIIGAVGVAILACAWFAIRYWTAVATTERAADLPTPTLDHLNAAALQEITQLDPEEEGHLEEEVREEPAPEDLAAVVPDDDIVDHAKRPHDKGRHRPVAGEPAPIAAEDATGEDQPAKLADIAEGSVYKQENAPNEKSPSQGSVSQPNPPETSSFTKI